MKLLPVILLFVAVFANSEVIGDLFECYKCSGDDCNGEATTAIVNCYDDTPIVPVEPTTPTTSEGTTPTTTGGTTPTTSEGTTATTSETTQITTGTSTTTDGTTTTTEGTRTTTTETTTTESETSTVSASEILLKNYRAIARKRRAADDNYECYILKFKDGDKTKTQKGCAKKTDGENSCNNVAPPAETSIEICEICSEPRCNSSPAIHLSILAIATAFYIRYFV